MSDLAIIFIQRIDNLMAEAKEIRLVFDTYTKLKSLKTNTRESRKKTIKQLHLSLSVILQILNEFQCQSYL